MIRETKTIVDQCNEAVRDLLTESMQRMFDEAASSRRTAIATKLVYPIMAMMIEGDNVSLSAKIIKHREKAVLISNEVTEFWVPRSHVIRAVNEYQTVITGWIAARKAHYLIFTKNESPQYLKWLEEKAFRKKYPYTGPGFAYKFDGKI